MRITHDQMTEYIQTGQAQQWEQPLGGLVPTATKMGGSWYVVLDGGNDYQAASPQLGDTLTKAQELLTIADDAMNKAERNHIRQPVTDRKEQPSRPSARHQQLGSTVNCPAAQEAHPDS